MAVYDVFPFFNELDILDIRLNTLNSVVDYFLITEATTTFSGMEKKLFLSENIDLFSKFRDKIIIQVVDDVPDLGPFERDWYQRDQAKVILSESLNENDLILYGDVDEIPKPESVILASKELSETIKIIHFAQNLNYYYLNLMETSGTLISYAGEYENIMHKKWLGTTLSKWSYAEQFTMTELRNPEHKKVGFRMDDGGWHFSYVGGEYGASVEQRSKIKVASSAHQELNNKKIVRKIGKRTSKHKDIFGRKGACFETIVEKNYLPVYVQENLNNFDYLLAK
jgi:beta-1,4-mannosyl-glycoprotein beta-1,4-N-acetylglucosaminyltransferase